MIKVQCPNCNTKFDYTLLTGRPRSNITVKNVYEACQTGGSVASAAEKLECTKSLIYLRLRQGGYDVREIFRREKVEE